MVIKTRKIIAVGLSLLMTLGAGAIHAEDTPMSGAAFDAFTRGKTLFYEKNGQSYGAESYLDNRRVRWSMSDGQCKEGYWFEDAGQICFVYEDDPSPRCWSFSNQDGKLTALFGNIPGLHRLRATEKAGQSLGCSAPFLGV